MGDSLFLSLVTLRVIDRGGKAQSIHSQNGLLVSHQASDQLADDKSVRALLNNYRSGRPLVLLIDDKYALFPYDLGSNGVTYAILGFYTIFYAWGMLFVIDLIFSSPVIS